MGKWLGWVGVGKGVVKEGYRWDEARWRWLEAGSWRWLESGSWRLEAWSAGVHRGSEADAKNKINDSVNKNEIIKNLIGVFF